MRPLALLLGLLAGMAAGLPLGGRGLEPAPQRPVGPAAVASPADPSKVEVPGLHNVYRVTDRLYSGSSPDGEEGFRSLRRLGVKTVLSVDGARPDVALAKKYGLRYAHLPVGYDGIARDQALRIARAVRDLAGPVYLHCHHGRHRGPAAAAVARLCLDEQCSAEMAVAVMRRAGTDPRYMGLYAAPATFRRPTRAELDRVPADFPQVAQVAALAQLMVEIDRRWEHLQLARAAGWEAPKDHPDVDPPHEALQLAEHYREAGRLDQARRRPAEFRRLLADAEASAKDLEAVLRAGKRKGGADSRAAEKAFRRTAAGCVDCHARYRDVPKGP